MSSTKGQGSLEYLLILGGAILVAVIIIAAVVSLGQDTSSGTEEAVRRNTTLSLCTTQTSEAGCETQGYTGVTADTVCAGTGGTDSLCCWNATASTCAPNPSNNYSG